MLNIGPKIIAVRVWRWSSSDYVGGANMSRSTNSDRVESALTNVPPWQRLAMGSFVTLPPTFSACSSELSLGVQPRIAPPSRRQAFATVLSSLLAPLEDWGNVTQESNNRHKSIG
jgi:hypothetical protein